VAGRDGPIYVKFHGTWPRATLAIGRRVVARTDLIAP
jgi:hypothetical protein